MTLEEFVDTKQVEVPTAAATTTTTTTTATIKTTIIKTKENLQSKKDSKVKPPARAIKIIQELIYWEYAKLIAKAAVFDKNYRFTMSRFMKLKNKQIKFSDISKDDEEAMMKERQCVYCGF
jgi:hypothetical protein